MSEPRERSVENRTKHPLFRLRRSDRGSILVLAAVGAGVVLGATALAVDLGMLLSARVQSQRVADAAALAGAQRLAAPGATVSQAKKEAQDYANRHQVLSNPVNLGSGDIDVIQEEGKVRVRIHHSIGTMFAKIFGVDAVNVSTVAAAKAFPSTGAVCPLPIIVVDGYTDLDNDGLYDSGEPYTQCTDATTPCTGFNLYGDDLENDVGLLIEVKSQNNAATEGALDPKEKTCGAANPEWYCWLDNINGSGVGTVEVDNAVNGCTAGDPFEIAIGDDVESSPGNKVDVVQEMKTYIDNNDPNHEWSPSDRCVVDGGGQCVGSSKRIRPIALGDPTTIASSGSNASIQVNNVMSVFMEKVASDFDKVHGQNPPPGQWNIYLRVLEAAQGGTGTDGTEGSLLKTVVLVE